MEPGCYKETREGAVYHRLLTKLETINEAFQASLQTFSARFLRKRAFKDLLLDAIRYNDQPEVRARLTQSIDAALDTSHIKSLLERNALCPGDDERRTPFLR